MKEGLKYLLEIAERVIDKYEETLYEDIDEHCDPSYARHAALREIERYLENLGVLGEAKHIELLEAISSLSQDLIEEIDKLIENDELTISDVDEFLSGGNVLALRLALHDAKKQKQRVKIVAVMDEHTCDVCALMHDRELVVPPPFINCDSDQGCRCKGIKP